MGVKFGYCAEDLPVTEELSGRLPRLPIYYEITTEEQKRVVEAIAEYLESKAAKSKITLGSPESSALVRSCAGNAV